MYIQYTYIIYNCWLQYICINNHAVYLYRSKFTDVANFISHKILACLIDEYCTHLDTNLICGVEDFTYLPSCVLAIKYTYMHVPSILHRQ